MRRILLPLALLILLSACSSVRPPVLGSELFQDQWYGPRPALISAEQVLATSPAMEQFLEQEVLPRSKKTELRLALFQAISQNNRISLEYDASLTRNATQAFEAKTGNCLSLVLMTSALAKKLGLQVDYRHVLLDTLWQQADQLVLATGHVNIALGRYRQAYMYRSDDNDALVIDFLPPPEAIKYPSFSISEARILAMYFNNRAAESIQQARLNDAYWYAKSAIEQDPGFLPALNTLGVIYQRGQHYQLASQIYRQVLALAPDYLPTLSNLQDNLYRSGDSAGARQIQAQLTQLHYQEPFRHFQTGKALYQQASFTAARNAFQEQLSITPQHTESYHWLAMTYLQLGDTAKANQQLVLARESATTVQTRQRFDLKLQALRAALH
ncbi:tetratricopeptide repeat protein [Undibacterium rugosum]|uniref:tetratricopeptide repeat protein n=1 Tax=Undibacterium rugosum TaxID=2762291 RepID=UPI001B82B62F|nr:hypothetical protein [Undibacterium rugosum]MBR7777299.1 hypothetical protein [Undibacterium rugosum]